MRMALFPFSRRLPPPNTAPKAANTAPVQTGRENPLRQSAARSPAASHLRIPKGAVTVTAKRMQKIDFQTRRSAIFTVKTRKRKSPFSTAPVGVGIRRSGIIPSGTARPSTLRQHTCGPGFPRCSPGSEPPAENTPTSALKKYFRLSLQN